uniref:prostaglandin E synthase n=1 Tax=Oncorhynchus gorbuscha TaxID=8017 RepID=UPI001EAF3D45|nr:prostaglandin E synthase [Oncorhynchus gorbuscha]
MCVSESVESWCSIPFHTFQLGSMSTNNSPTADVDNTVVLHLGIGRPYQTIMLENEAFSCFVFYSVLLVIKMYIIAIITGQVRLRKKAFANPEDAQRHGGVQYYREDPDVERCRRAHRNDMENIFPFLFLGAVYSLIGPSLAVARAHFLVFFLFRMLHTVAYLCVLRAPTRSLAYVVAQVPCVSMAVQVLAAVASSW